jgi:hypothetical protein
MLKSYKQIFVALSWQMAGDTSFTDSQIPSKSRPERPVLLFCFKHGIISVKNVRKLIIAHFI